jgi:DNA-directed RNA polymerase specialized sigma subunit
MMTPDRQRRTQVTDAERRLYAALQNLNEAARGIHTAFKDEQMSLSQAGELIRLSEAQTEAELLLTELEREKAK